jgi:tRNA(Leu) C34 or U34 (ribose-2'-O)-methylase TrmL
MRGYAAVGLDGAKNHLNVGAALRAAFCFDVAMVAVSGKRYHRSHVDTPKSHLHLPLLQCDDLRSVIPFDCVPVAVELVDGAVPLMDYVHPERAFYVFGAEDQTLGDRVLSWCRDKVYIPTRTCLNLSMCVNVVLYDRFAKAHARAKQSARATRKATG